MMPQQAMAIPLAPAGRPEQDVEQFGGLLESVLDAGYRVAYHLARQVADAEDLVQEAALLACRHRNTFEAGTNFKAWFLRIVTNCFYSKCRRPAQARESVSLDTLLPPRLAALAGEAGLAQEPDPAEALLRRVDADIIGSALAALPDEFRVVTMMYLVDDLSYQDIAFALEIPIGTVRSRLHRGRGLLQRALWQLAAERGMVH